MKANRSRKTISKDILLYLPAKIIEGIVGIITLTIYTGLFSPEVYGEYVVINPTINIIFLILLGWLMHSLYRYINTYKDNNNIKELCSTGFVSYITLVFIVFSMIVIIIVSGKELISPKLLFISFYMFVAYGLSQILFNLSVALKKIKLNLTLSVSGTVFKLLFTIVLAKNYSRDVIIILISHGTVDMLVGLILFLKLKAYNYISITKFSKDTLRTMFGYGFPLIGLSLTMFVLNISDRYVIRYFYEGDALGIYGANYSLASAVYIMMMMGIMRAVYPNLLATWSKHDVNRTKELLSGGARYYLMICIPATVGLIMLSKSISRMFLDSAYHDGYAIIGWTAIGMLFFGLTEYCNKAWELTSNTKVILLNSLISGLINITLNIIFIPIYGYGVAAITTMVSFALYFILSYIGARKILIWSIKPISFIRIIGSAASFGVFLMVINYYFEMTLTILLLSIIASIIIYIVLLLITGELTEERKMIQKRFKRL